jgi:dipeptidyl aminopeptidase/acylaminoacyl peptidase
MAQQSYQLPPQSIVDVIDAKPTPAVSFSPDGNWMLLTERDAMPAIADLSRRMLRLAGMRIDPVANAGFRTDFVNGLQLRSTDDPKSLKRIPLPAGGKVASISWCHRSDALVFACVTSRGSELWLAPVATPSDPVRLTDRLSTIGGLIDWAPDGQSLLCRVVPSTRGPEPPQPTVPTGPNIQESVGNVSPIRTFQDLLTSDYDEALFEYYATSELVRIDRAGRVTSLGAPAMFMNAGFAPDGQHLLVSTIKRPFSRLMTAGSFPGQTQVWNVNGEVLYTVVETPLAENIPIEGVPVWRRSISWRPDQPATLIWAEALDGGDPRTKVPARDKLLSLAAPFSSEPQELCRVEHRFSGLSWIKSPARMLCSEFDRDRRWTRTLIYDASDFQKPAAVLFDRSIRDRYGDPGSPVTRPDETGFQFVVCADDSIWLAGSGASPDGDLPFFDRMDLTTRATTRLWRCESGHYERVSGCFTGADGRPQRFVTSHESPTEPPNYRARDMGGRLTAELTDFPDPIPQIRGIQKQLVTYKRSDGVPLSATMYLPADWKPGQRLPLFIWAYPLEFSDASTAGQVSGSPHTFTEINGISHLALVLAGYAVMDNATMPVIGEPETANDTFVEQISGAAEAAINHAVEMGVGDRDRVAVGGHSYGAFMTANLLAHTKLFKAGIARSGAYNRTLTPFGFQAERRPYWEAREVYEKVSPFTWANQIQTPLLLIHGEADNNSGTFPIQSERLYQAVKGNGGTVRLVTLPHESHGYRARESVLHTQAEMLDWLNRFVGEAKAESKSTHSAR